MLNLKKSKKGSFDLYVIFFISGLLILLFAFFIVPFSIKLYTTSIQQSEKIMNYATDDLNNIQDENIKQSLTESFSDAINSNKDSIDIMTFFYKYSWLLIIVVVLLILFMVARQRSEYMRGVV